MAVVSFCRDSYKSEPQLVLVVETSITVHESAFFALNKSMSMFSYHSTLLAYDRYRWYALGLTTWGQAATNILGSAFGPLAPFLQDDLHISRTQVGLISTAVFLTAAPSALFGGRAADRVGERQVLILSGVLGGFAALAVTMSSGFWTLVVSCLGLGLGNGIQNPAGSAAIMRWFPQHQRGFAMGIRQTGVPIGGMLAAGVAPLLALHYGWRSAYLAGAILSLIGAVLIVVAYFDPPRKSIAGTVGAMRSLRDLARDKRLLRLALIFNCQVFTHMAATTYFVLFLHEALNTSVVTAGVLFVVVNIAAMMARIGWGLVSDRRFQGQRRPVLLMIIALTVCSTLCAALLPSRTSLWLVGALSVLFGISAFAWTGILGTLVIEIAGPESAGSAISMVQVLSTPATLLAPPLFGLLADLSGSYHASWLVLTLIGTVGLITLRWVQEAEPS
jgi:ACS family hexuronate transporter-like MFS transporter